MQKPTTFEECKNIGKKYVHVLLSYSRFSSPQPTSGCCECQSKEDRQVWQPEQMLIDGCSQYVEAEEPNPEVVC